MAVERSSEVQEILGKTPNWLVKWGSTVVSLSLLLLLGISHLIKYEDVVICDISITNVKRNELGIDRNVLRSANKYSLVFFELSSLSQVSKSLYFVEKGTIVHIIGNSNINGDLCKVKGEVFEINNEETTIVAKVDKTKELDQCITNKTVPVSGKAEFFSPQKSFYDRIIQEIKRALN